MQNNAVMTTELATSPLPKKAAASVDVDSKEQTVPFEETLSKQLQQQKNNSSKTGAKSTKTTEAEQKDSIDTPVTSKKNDVEKSVKKEEKKPIGDGNKLPTTVNSNKTETDIVSSLIDGDSEKVTDVVTAKTAEIMEKGNVDVSPTSNEAAIEGNVDTSDTTPHDVVTHSQVAPTVNVSTEDNSKTVKEQQANSSSTAKTTVPSTTIDNSKLKSTVKEVPLQSTEQTDNTKVQLSPKQDNAGQVLADTQSRDKDFVVKQINIAKQSNQATGTIVANEQQVDEAVVSKTPQATSQAKTSTLLNVEKQKDIAVDIAKHLTQSVSKNATQQPKVSVNVKPDSGIGITKIAENALVSTKNSKEMNLTGAQREQLLLDKATLVDNVMLKTSKPELASATTVLSNSGFTTTSSAASTVSSTSTPLTPLLDVQPTLKSEAWGKVMVGRVIWMAKEGIQNAQLKLNPAQLGPVEVRVALNNDQANVSFVAQNAATRDALEQALPRLRESFQANGMALANADVSDQSSSQQFDQHHGQQQGDIIFSQNDEEVDELVDNKIVIEESKSGLSLYV